MVRPDGPVFVAAISRFASLFDGLVRGLLFEAGFKDIVDRDLLEGQHRNPTGRPDWFTTAYFHHPEELRAEAGDAGLEVVEVLGVEGMAGWVSDLASRSGLRRGPRPDRVLGPGHRGRAHAPRAQRPPDPGGQDAFVVLAPRPMDGLTTLEPARHSATLRWDGSGQVTDDEGGSVGTQRSDSAS